MDRGSSSAAARVTSLCVAAGFDPPWDWSKRDGHKLLEHCTKKNLFPAFVIFRGAFDDVPISCRPFGLRTQFRREQG